MKKCVFLILLCSLLWGCSAAETFETVGDDQVQQVTGAQKELVLTVGEDAVILQSGAGVEYLCDGYTVATEILESGDLSGTFRAVTGMSSDALTVIETSAGGIARYESVWTAAGEGGDTVCRMLILDDGAWHYCVSITAPADRAGELQETWQEIFASVGIV